MSSTGGVNSSNFDNSDYPVKPQQTAGNTGNSALVFDFPADFNAGLDVYGQNGTDSPIIDENTLLEMLEAGKPIGEILGVIEKADLLELIGGSIDVKNYFVGENSEYKTFYENNVQVGNETKFIDLYSDENMSISEISAALENNESYPLDLSKNKFGDLLIKIKARFNTANFDDKREIISQLEKLTGISLKNVYKNKDGYDLSRLFAVLYSLAQKLASLEDNESVIIDGKNVSGAENIIKEINSQIETIVNNSDNGNVVKNLTQTFASVCRESLIRNNDSVNDNALKESFDPITKQQVKYAWSLRVKYNNLLKSATPGDKQKAQDILDPNLKLNAFLNTQDYIQKVIAAIKVLDSTFDEHEFAQNLENEFNENNLKVNSYLLKIHNDYTEIKDALTILQGKSNKTDEEIQLLEKYERIENLYQQYIKQNNISVSDLEQLNNEELINIDEIVLDDDAINFLENENKKHKIRSNIVHFAVRKNKIDNNPHIKAMIDEVFSAVPEIKNKSHAEALQILHELKNNSENQDRLDIIDNLIESFEILNEDDLAKIGNWHEMITQGATDEELKQVIDSLVQDIKTRYPDKELDESAIATMISNYIISSCDQRYNEKIVYITDYILNNYDVKELNDIHYISITASQNENLTKEQASYFVNKAKEAGEINKQKLYMVGTQGESVMSEMSKWEDLDPEIRSYMESLINNDYNGNYSDDFKEEIMHNLGYSDYCASTDSSGSPNTTGNSSPFSSLDNQSILEPNVYVTGTIDDRDPKNSHETLHNNIDKNKNITDLSMATNPLMADKIFQKDPKVQTLRQIIEEGVDENGDPVRDSERQEATLYLWKISPSKVYELERGAAKGAAKFFLKVPDFDRYIILTQNRTKGVYDIAMKENLAFYDQKKLKLKENPEHNTQIT